MMQLNLDESYDTEAVADYRQGVGAAAWMAKAVATVYGWEYQHHQQFGVVMHNASILAGNELLNDLSDSVYRLHTNYYTRRRFLSAAVIGRGLDRMAELLEALEPLTVPGNGQSGG